MDETEQSDSEITAKNVVPAPEQSRPEPAKPTLADGPRRSRGGRLASFVLWMLILAALVASGGSAWLLWQKEPRLDEMAARLDMLERDQIGRAAGTAALESAQIEFEEGAELWRAEQEQALIAVQQSQREQLRRLAEMATTDRGDWLLAEAEYLLRLGNQRLLLGGDTGGSVALLLAADNILLEMDSPRLHEVRAAVAADVAALRATGTPDTEGTWLRIEALIGQVEALPMFVIPERVVAARKEIAEDTWTGRLQSGMRAGMDKLSQMLVIRRREAVYEPLVSPQWEHLARQNLRLVLEQAQASLLTGNGELYRASLAKAIHWLNTYFKLNERGVAAIDEELTALMAVPVTRDLPDISGSLTVLKAHIDQVHGAVTGSVTVGSAAAVEETDQ